MGAGIQRWWRPSHRDVCDAWMAKQRIHLTQAIVVAKKSELSVLRLVINAFTEIWRHRK